MHSLKKPCHHTHSLLPAFQSHPPKLKNLVLLSTLFLHANALSQPFDSGTSCGLVAVHIARDTFEPGSNGATVGFGSTSASQAILSFATQFYGVEYSVADQGLTDGGLDGINTTGPKAKAYISKFPDIKC